MKKPLRHSMVEEVPKNGSIWQNSGEHLRLVERTERVRERLREQRGIGVRRRSSRWFYSELRGCLRHILAGDGRDTAVAALL
jgi:hypothetical protein